MFCSEKHKLPRSPRSIRLPRVTRTISRIHREGVPAARQQPLRPEWFRSRSARRRWAPSSGLPRFCGVVGFKPTFGKLPVHGVLPFAPSLDTVGILVCDVATCIYVWRALGFPSETGPVHFAIPDNLPAVSEEMQSIFDKTVSTLGQEYPVEKIELPNKYEDLLAAAKLVNDYEGSRSHEKRWREYGDRMGQKLASLIGRGLQISEAAWHESLQCLREASVAMEKIFAEIPFALTPAALESAPEGFASTGDPAMNAVWTAMGTPAVGIPMPVAAGLPLGLQMIGARDTEASLLNAALAAERQLHREHGTQS